MLKNVQLKMYISTN